MKTSILGLILYIAFLVSTFELSTPDGSTSLYSALGIRSSLISRAGTVDPAVKKMKNDTDIAHGVLMGIAVVLVLPIGAIMTRFPGGRSLGVRIHVYCQIFGMVLLLAGFGLGVWTCIIHNEVFTDPHTSLGTAIVGLFFIQPTLGYLHHRRYTEKGTRSWWTQAHIWFGRIILILAIINGGYGIKYAKNSLNGEIWYGVISAIVASVYIGLALLWYLRSHRAEKDKVKEPEMRGDTTDLGEKHEEIIMESPTTQGS